MRKLIRKINAFKRKIKKIETSKKIITYILILTTITVFYTFHIIEKTGDTSALQVLIPAIFAELATGTAFYYKKAESENKIKIAKMIDSAEKEIKKKITIDDVYVSDDIKEVEDNGIN